MPFRKISCPAPARHPVTAARGIYCRRLRSADRSNIAATAAGSRNLMHPSRSGVRIFLRNKLGALGKVSGAGGGRTFGYGPESSSPRQVPARAQDVGEAVRLVEIHAAGNAADAIGIGCRGVHDGNSRPDGAKRVRDVPAVAMSVQFDVGHQHIDLHAGAAQRNGAFSRTRPRRPRSRHPAGIE